VICGGCSTSFLQLCEILCQVMGRFMGMGEYLAHMAYDATIGDRISL
jgi:hypothetical protein